MSPDLHLYPVSDLRKTSACMTHPKVVHPAPEDGVDFLYHRLHWLADVLPEDVSELYLPPLFVLAGQLLGLYASLREGLRPDEPSPHGAISRVVSHVTIH